MAYEPTVWVDDETPVNAENLNKLEAGVAAAVLSVNGNVPDENGNVDLTGYATEDWVRKGYQPKGDYLTEHQDISGKLDADKLPEAINTALAQAKASGAFKGDPGEKGEQGIQGAKGEKGDKGDTGAQGPKGADGYTPVKGVDYFDGKDGAKGDTGPQGEQGPKGDKGDTGPQGPQGEAGQKGDKGDTGAPGTNGTNGKDGADGKTPVKGTDYYTEADKAEMVNRVISALPTWTGGSY